MKFADRDGRVDITNFTELTIVIEVSNIVKVSNSADLITDIKVSSLLTKRY